MSIESDVVNVIAPSPEGAGFITLNAEVSRIEQLASLGRKSLLFEYVYNVCGVAPPVNNIGYHEKDESPFKDSWGGLRHAHSIFKGVNRPLNRNGVDEKVYIYVISPKYVYTYVPDMVCVAKRKAAPGKAVFVVYVLFEKEFSEGKIVNWEWVIADQEDPLLPANFNERYNEKVWSNG